MKITLAGQHVFSTGKIAGYTDRSLDARIIALGGHPAATPNKSVTLALIGARASQKKLDQLQASGVLCLEGDAITALLRDGEVEHVEEQDTRSADELFGEVRSLLARPLSHALWGELCALVDQVAADQQDVLIDYLQAQLARWPSPAITADELRSDWRYGIFSDAAGELRYLPNSWLTAALRGEDHAKFKLCKAVAFSVIKVSSSAAQTIFDNPAIAHMEVFDVGWTTGENMKKATFYKAMASSKHLGNIKTLMVGDAPAGALDALHGAASLPSLRAIHLRASTHNMSAPDKGAALFAAGPWAAALECVGVNHPAHLDTLLRDLPHLPSLRAIALSTHARTEPEDFVALAAALKPLAAQLKEVTLATTSIDDNAQLDGYGALLDALAGSALDVLDLRLGTELAGEQGEAFVTKHLIQNGLGARVGVILAGDRLAASACALLRAHGVDVVADSDGASAPDAAPVAEQQVVGEPVAAPSGLSVADFLVFEEPCEEAWHVLISVVNGLERELEPARFAQAIDQLEAHLTSWPDELRMLPAQWWGALLADEMDPKLRLVRAFWMDMIGVDDDPKHTSNLLLQIAQSKHLRQISWLGFWLYGAQRHALDAVAAMFEAVQPTHHHLVTKSAQTIQNFKDRLNQAGIQSGDEVAQRLSRHRSHSATPDALALRHVTLKVEDPAAFAALIQRTDLEHVIALELHMAWHERHVQGVDWGAMQAQIARLPALRYLKLRVYKLPAPAKALLVRWLSAARPLFIDDPMGSMEPCDTPVLELMEAGVYSRAFGSYATLPSQLDVAQLDATLGSGAVQIAGLRLMYGDLRVPDMTTLLAHMHPTLRARLSALHWIITDAELSQAAHLCAQLPSLTLWNPQSDGLATTSGRAPLLTALSQAPAARSIFKVQLSTSRTGKPDKLTAPELKLLDKGCGLASKSLSQRALSSLRFS